MQDPEAWEAVLLQCEALLRGAAGAAARAAGLPIFYTTGSNGPGKVRATKRKVGAEVAVVLVKRVELGALCLGRDHVEQPLAPFDDI